jgi:hypothetical protein
MGKSYRIIDLKDNKNPNTLIISKINETLLDPNPHEQMYLSTEHAGGS